MRLTSRARGGGGSDGGGGVRGEQASQLLLALASRPPPPQLLPRQQVQQLAQRGWQRERGWLEWLSGWAGEANEIGGLAPGADASFCIQFTAAAAAVAATAAASPQNALLVPLISSVD